MLSRPLWWWHRVYEDRKSGADVEGKLQDHEYEPSRRYRLLEEWGYDSLKPRGICTLEQAAQLLQVPDEEVLELLSEGELKTNAHLFDMANEEALERLNSGTFEAPGRSGILGISLHSVIDKTR